MEAEGGPPEALQGPEQQRIGVFLRLRPVPRLSGRVVSSPEEGWVEFNVPKDASQGIINNSRETYRFPFDGLLPPTAGQAEVFERVALPVLRSALEGYNGTVFAFGQTGSGKTFTISGGTERYADRGLIPRTLSALFSEAARRSDYIYSLHVSYMEIYCEAGFDLLEPNRAVQALEDLPKVHVLEDDDAHLHLRNLSLHRCETEEQALNMLFLGDTNRVVAETPLNQASSRSHCVFTLHIEARRAGEALVRRSKLHFVDLAGSERVVKTGLAAATQLKEAKYINLSLHFLEQVIISLQEGRPHVPYRNSMLTQVLRDSLGGNTCTVMVAAVAPEAQHIEESISTCRFAQRVAMITNRVVVNEELDLELVVKRLKQENALLRQELQLLRSGGAGNGGGGDGTTTASPTAEGGGPEQRQVMSEGEQQALRRQVLAFVEDSHPGASLDVQPSMLFIHAAFAMLKSMARGRQVEQQQQAAHTGGTSSIGGDASGASAEVHSLRQLVHEQERQIAVLAGVLRKQGLVSGESGAASIARASQQNSHQSLATPALRAASRPSSSSGNSSSRNRQPQRSDSGGAEAGGGAGRAIPFSDDLLADQHKAFEYFCTTSPAHDAVAEHKSVLRGKYEEARALGTCISASKQRISELKAVLERRRLAHSMAVLLRQQAGGRGDDEDEEGRRQDEGEERAKGLIEKEKGVYREAYGALRGIKAEVDGVQASLKRARARLQHDFQAWYAAMTLGGGGGHGDSSAAGLQKQTVDQAGKQSLAAAARHLPEGTGRLQPKVQQQQMDAQQDRLILAGAPSSSHTEAKPLSATAPPSFSSWRVAPSFYFDQRGGQDSATASSPGAVPRVTPAGPGHAGPQGPQPRPQQQPQQQHSVQQLPRQQQQEEAAEAVADPFAGVEPEVLVAARPLLTGNPQADSDIIRFYQARHALLRSMH